MTRACEFYLLYLANREGMTAALPDLSDAGFNADPDNPPEWTRVSQMNQAAIELALISLAELDPMIAPRSRP